MIAGMGALPGGGNAKYSAATYKAFSKQLNQYGIKTLIKTQACLTEHINKLNQIRQAGGYASSVEREIRTFQSQLDAINDILK